MAWLQVKQHQELAHAYGLGAHELGIVEIRAHLGKMHNHGMLSDSLRSSPR